MPLHCLRGLISPVVAAALLSGGAVALGEPREGGPGPAGAAPQPRQGFGFEPPPGVGHVGIRKMVNDTGQTTVVEEDERTITIAETDDGIRVEVRDTRDAEPRTFRAPDADTLKAEAPEAWELYARYCLPVEKGGGLMMHPADPNAGPGQLMMIGGELTRRIESLGIRIMLEPTPLVQAQLGRGVSVTKVADGSRGQALGLRPYDYVKKINGREVAELEEFAEMVEAAGEGKLSFEVLREGQPLTVGG